MSNMPITTNAPQTAVPSKQAANASDNGDVQNNQPFGEVLARQIGVPAKKDAKADDKLAADILALPGTETVSTRKDANEIKVVDARKKDGADTKKTDPAATDGTTTLPADMLAALIPQAIANTAASNASSGSQGNKSDSTAISGNTTENKRNIVALKTDAPATGRMDGTAQTAPVTGNDAKVKDQSFAMMMTDQARTAAGGAAAHIPVGDKTPVPTSPQANAATLAALQNTAANIAAPSMQPAQVTINTPVNQDKWSDEFGQKITWLASSNKDQTAELHLNPPHLGPLDVVLKVSGDQATALFTSPHAAVRDAIEQAMPRLRDMMADNGIMLGNATVSDQTPRDQGQTRSDAQRTSISTGNDIQPSSLPGSSAVRVSPISRHNGIVDTFA